MDRTSAAIALVCLFAVISCGVLLRDAADASGKPDLVATYEQRFSPLRDALPKGATVGYLTDIPAGDLTAQTELYLLQYAVAPLIVQNRADLPWVIGNFRSTEGMTKALEGKGLIQVRDLGRSGAIPQVILSLWLALHLVLGFLVGRALWPPRGCLALRGALSVGLGCGFGSCLYFLGMLAGIPAVAVAVMELLAAVGLWLRPWAGTAYPQKAHAGWTLPSVFVLCMLLGVIGMTVLTLAIPHGTWDAWAIWNLRARFLVRAGADWRVAFSPLLAEHHPDYPLLLPAMHAFGWKLSGSESMLGPVVVALGFTLSTVGLLWGGLDLLRGRSIAYLSALVLAATPFFWKHGAAQYADIPLAFFLLGALILLSLDRRETHPGLAVLAGLCAGFAAWTKNEGIVLAALLIAAMVIAQRGSLPGFFAGLTPGALCLAIFKLTLAPPSYLLASVAQPLSDRLADLTRYSYLASGLAVEVLGFGQTPLNPILLLIACFFLFGRDPKRPPLAVAAITLAGGLTAYLAVLLASPLDFQWQVSTALPRLLLQLWPSAILLCFLALREPEPPTPEGPKKKGKKR